MLIFGTLGIAITAIAVWSAIHGQNGFAELVNMIQGKPSFIVIDRSSAYEQAGKGEGGPVTGVAPEQGGTYEPRGSGGGGGGAW